MHKTPRLESLETRTLLAGVEGVDDDSLAVSLDEPNEDVEGTKKSDELSERAQKKLDDLAIFSTLIIGTAISVVVGMYFGETV